MSKRPPKISDNSVGAAPLIAHPDRVPAQGRCGSHRVDQYARDKGKTDAQMYAVVTGGDCPLSNLGLTHFPVGVSGQLQLVFRLYISSNDQNCFVRRIILTVKRKRIIQIQPFYFMTPADDRFPIWMMKVEFSISLFTKGCARVIFHPLILLIYNHFALCQDIVRTKVQIDHPVSLHAHHQWQKTRHDSLKITSIIKISEDIFTTPVFCNNTGKFP